MNGRTLLITGALALSTLGVASAKSYSIILSEPTKVGTSTLKPGEYEVSVKGDQAIFKSDSGQPVSVPVKVEQGAAKFGQTAVDASNKDGMNSIQEIDLGGSATRLEFGQ
jgi:hypothetical protein